MYRDGPISVTAKGEIAIAAINPLTAAQALKLADTLRLVAIITLALGQVVA